MGPALPALEGVVIVDALSQHADIQFWPGPAGRIYLRTTHTVAVDSPLWACLETADADRDAALDAWLVPCRKAAGLKAELQRLGFHIAAPLSAVG